MRTRSLTLILIFPLILYPLPSQSQNKDSSLQYQQCIQKIKVQLSRKKSSTKKDFLKVIRKNCAHLKFNPTSINTSISEKMRFKRFYNKCKSFVLQQDKQNAVSIKRRISKCQKLASLYQTPIKSHFTDASCRLKYCFNNDNAHCSKYFINYGPTGTKACLQIYTPYACMSPVTTNSALDLSSSQKLYPDYIVSASGSIKKEFYCNTF